ncbi:MAG: ATP-binding protein [Myxococcota bacterium]
MKADALPMQSLLDFSATDARAGFRLDRLEVFNWGTFHRHVWTLLPRGHTVLVTGDIGSGKSTLVDALTTLLVPPQRVAYNKAAGADARERTVRSYVLGHYKSERGDQGLSARPVALRDYNTYSVILAAFHNEGLGQTVTLAQVFWLKDHDGQPARMLLVADGALSIAEHFSNFGTDVADLRKRLRKMPNVELFDSFQQYGAAFRRRMGIQNEQALELFHQTVSMKSVGNLTEFVRQHMLEAFPVEDRIAALIHHFDDLSRAHASVLKAREQVAALTPLVADCERHAALTEGVALLRADREALRGWFCLHKEALAQARVSNLSGELTRLEEELEELRRRQVDLQVSRDELRGAISANGGDRLERLKRDIQERTAELNARQHRARQYGEVARALGLSELVDADSFARNREALEEQRVSTETQRADVQNRTLERNVEFKELRGQHTELSAELESLRRRRSNIPSTNLRVRTDLCNALALAEEDLPFAGEHIQVREEEKDWEGAAERLLRGFGLSLLVPDEHYESVAQWVDRTHLRDRLVYFRVRAVTALPPSSSHPRAMVHKLAIRPDSAFYAWLEAELHKRANMVCCETLEEFRREKNAITRAGQLKGAGERHEKDDRRAIDDRSHYVLGWSNEEKIRALEKRARDVEKRIQDVAEQLSVLQREATTLQQRMEKISQLRMFENHRDIHWQPLAVDIQRMEEELRELEKASDQLRVLRERLKELDAELDGVGTRTQKIAEKRGTIQERHETATSTLQECRAVLETVSPEVRERHFPRLEEMRPHALGEQNITLENAEAREQQMRRWLQARIDAEDERGKRLAENVVRAMQQFRAAWPAETQEVDASIQAAHEYRTILQRLQADDLPRFEQRFKELLNENTIREVANFQSQLHRERQTIKERIDRINRSLRGIEYNDGRYIVLESQVGADADIRDFQQDLRACTEGALTGSTDEEYSEAKFLRVKSIIERLRGREGHTDADLRWTRKVTDVRNWFTFSASERWLEDDREHEHYTDSAGKSGGQKEKLAYTVLAASLAYQFGLETGDIRSRTFRFVVIDEAFGRGSDESARYGLELFKKLNLQLLVVTPLQKIHIIEPYVTGVGFVHNQEGRLSMLRNLTIEEYRAERAARSA